MKIIAATGHRPDRLGGYSEVVLAKLMQFAQTYLKKEKPDKVISGMAQGWDTAFAMAALSLNIPLVAAIPFAGQELKWSSKDQKLYKEILAKSAEVVTVCRGTYQPWKMQARNAWMVDHCTKVAALWDGNPGGTKNCVLYAHQKSHPIDYLWNDWSPLTWK
jgi:uncharacterized phage-like protein YoqJ